VSEYISYLLATVSTMHWDLLILQHNLHFMHLIHQNSCTW